MNTTDISQNVKELADKTTNTAEESTKDWFYYVQKHPIQTLILGLACVGIGAVFNKIWPSD